MQNNNITCIYHKDCVDGTTAAAVLLRKFPHARLFPLSHGYTPEDIEPVLSRTEEGAHIYIVDSTLGVREFLACGHSVTIIDHHVSVHESMCVLADAEERLSYIFDNAKSGASLTWSYFFPDEPLPELIRYVEDSDLWKGEFGTVTKDVAHYLSIWRNNPAHVLELIEGGGDEVKQKGAIISEYTDKTIERLVLVPPITLELGEYSVLAFNITDHQSACGNILATRHDQAVALFTIKGEEVRLSFRSLSHHEPSALDLALTQDGGGGHRNASGADMSLVDFLGAVEYEGIAFPEDAHKETRA